MADRPSLGDRFVREFGDAVASVRTALIDRAWFGYEELSRTHDTLFSTAPYIDRSVEQAAPAELIESAWFRSDRDRPGPHNPVAQHDLGREFLSERERHRDEPGIDIDR